MDRTTLGRTMLPPERDGLIAIKDGILDRRSKELAVTKAGTERACSARNCGSRRRRNLRSGSTPDERPICAAFRRSRFVRARKGRLRLRPATPTDSSEALTVRYLEVRTERQELVPDAYPAESCKAHRSIPFQ